MKSRVEAHFEDAHKRPWIIPNGEEVEEEEAGKSNTDPNDTNSRQVDNPDDPEPMDDAPVPDVIQKEESSNATTEATRYESHLEVRFRFVDINVIIRLRPGKPLTAAELDDLKQRLKGKRQALATNKKILEQTASTQPDGGAKLRECIEKIEVRKHKNS